MKQRQIDTITVWAGFLVLIVIPNALILCRVQGWL